MDQTQLINAFRQIMPRINASGAPDAEMLKYASEHNLPPAVLEKLAQVFNNAKTLKVYSSAAKEADRGRNFEIIDVPELLSKYTSWAPAKQAAVGLSPDALSWLESDSVSMRKAAAKGTVTALPRSPHFQHEIWGEQRYEIREEAEKQASAPQTAPTRAEMLHELDIMGGVIAEHRDKLYGIFELRKEAARNNPLLAQQIWHDLESEHDTEAIRFAMRKFASWCIANGAPQRGLDEKDTRPLADDRHKAAAWVSDVIDTITTIRACASYGKELAKQANAVDWAEGMADVDEAYSEIPAERLAAGAQPDLGAGEPQVLEWGTGGRGQSNDKPKPEKEESAEPSDTPTQKGPSSEKKPKSPLLGPSVGRAKINPEELQGAFTTRFITDRLGQLSQVQDVQDEAVSNLEAATVIQRLMLNDPVLKESDPNMVVSLFNTIRKANPNIASDPNLLRMALQEAVQYEGLPLHSYDQLLDTRNKADKRPDKDSGGKKSPGVNLSLLGL